MRLRVLVVSRDPWARPDLAAGLEGPSGYAVVGHAGTDDELGAAISAASPDVILWDVDPESELTALHEVAVPVVALAGDRSMARALLAAGARACVSQNIDGPRLAAVLEAAAQGFVVLDSAFAPWGPPLRGDDSEVLWAEDLTHRELEVLQLLAEGLPNREIAQRLSVSENTVKFHTSTIYSKLGVHSRTEAVARAARLGLITI